MSVLHVVLALIGGIGVGLVMIAVAALVVGSIPIPDKRDEET